MMQEWDVIIIGAGAAGLFCAIEAGKRGRKVLVIEHSATPGKKIRISGGGRCNFTNLYTAPENFISANPHFCKSALARFTPADFLALVEKHGIAWHEKKSGQLFCDDSAQQIIDLLLHECVAAGVELCCDCRVREVLRTSESPAFRLVTNREAVASSALVIATGGLSIPQLGATDFGYRVARQFGLQIEDPRPGLVPLTLDQQVQNRLAPLSGISLEAQVSCGGKTGVAFRENILVTHRGLSGPAILQISSYWKPGAPLTIDLLPGSNVLDLITNYQASGPISGSRSEKELANILGEHLPRRFARAWCELFSVSKPIRQYTQAELQRISEDVHRLQIKPSGTEGFRKAEVTAGGVATAELSSQTMESRRVSGLYFIGEVVDVTGHLGGYNFQWAWASGFAAGQVV
jgi:predicted Rossmann fold flavoprotein